MKKFLSIIFLSFLWLNFSLANELSIKADSIILLDHRSELVLYEKNADEIMYPGGMTKIMTTALAFHFIKNKELSLDEKFLVSEKAWRMSHSGYSSMFIMVGDRVSVENLLRGIIVVSGNDASIALAEGIAGSEEKFVEMMNIFAKKIGLNNTNFTNATGIYDQNHYSTVRDIATLSAYLIKNYPNLYNMFRQKDFTWDRTGGDSIIQGNRNPLLYLNINADGITSGYIRNEKYKLAASVTRDYKSKGTIPKRLVLVGSGFETKEDRSEESKKLFEWGYSNYDKFAEAIKEKISNDKKNPNSNNSDSNKLVAAASGSGFFVSDKGDLITNHHVIDQCEAVKVIFRGNSIEAKTLAIDRVNDIAILKANIKPDNVYSVSNEDVSLLEDVVVAGFPLGKKVSSAIKTHKGVVTSLAGAGDNFSNFQTDASINQGNSGGPIINQKGNVVGIAVATWVEQGVQGVHFGIKSSTLKTFANANGLKFLPPKDKEMTNKDLGKLITKATVYLECYMTVAKIKKMIAEEKNRKAFFSEYQ